MRLNILALLPAFLITAVIHSPAYADGSSSTVLMIQLVNDVEGDHFLGQGDELRVDFSANVTADANTATQFRFVIDWSNGRSIQTAPVTLQPGVTGPIGEEDVIIAGSDPHYEFTINVEWKYPNETLWNDAGVYDMCNFSSD